MSMWLKIENPGVCPTEGFILMGATSKRLALDESPFTIGQFGSGTKNAVNVLLRSKIFPIVYCGNHILEYGLKPGTMKALEGDVEYNRVVVKHGGTDENGTHVSYSEDLSQTDEHGSIDWDAFGMAAREFISNAIDAAIAMNIMEDREDERPARPWDLPRLREVINDVKIELVPDNQVRAKRNYTRVFIPADNESVVKFLANLGRWFLHFSEPELILESVLPKRNRNLNPDSQAAVIYRRGVFVREIADCQHSLFDYNLNNLRMDESRKVDDYACRDAAARVFADTESANIALWWKSFGSSPVCWEHLFQSYSLEPKWGDSPEKIAARKDKWGKALLLVGDDAVLTTKTGPKKTLEGKGFQPVEVPETIVSAANSYGVATPERVLSDDELNGRESFDATGDALLALDWAWSYIAQVGMDAGKSKPPVRCFRKVMDAGTVTQGFYCDGTVYINVDIAIGESTELRQVMLEELAHHLTGSCDETRDLQDWAFKFAVRVASL